MRKIDIIANEKFNGDTKKAIFTLLSQGQSIDEYVDEFTKEESEVAFNTIVDIFAPEYGGLDKLQEKVSMEMKMQSLDLTEDDLKNAQTNPYKAQLLKSFFKMLLVEGGVISLAVIGPKLGIDPSTMGLLGSVMTGLVSVDLAKNIINYFKFRKLKKQYDLDNSNLHEKEQNDGRTL